MQAISPDRLCNSVYNFNFNSCRASTSFYWFPSAKTHCTMTGPQPLWGRKRDLLYFVFFAIHGPLTLGMTFAIYIYIYR